MRHKKKVKSLHAQLAETRHELSLQMFEMRSEMEQLSEQNSDLKGMKNKTQLSEQSSNLKGTQIPVSKMTILLNTLEKINLSRKTAA